MLRYILRDDQWARIKGLLPGRRARRAGRGSSRSARPGRARSPPRSRRFFGRPGAAPVCPHDRAGERGAARGGWPPVLGAPRPGHDRGSASGPPPLPRTSGQPLDRRVDEAGHRGGRHPWGRRLLRHPRRPPPPRERRPAPLRQPGRRRRRAHRRPRAARGRVGRDGGDRRGSVRGCYRRPAGRTGEEAALRRAPGPRASRCRCRPAPGAPVRRGRRPTGEDRPLRRRPCRPVRRGPGRRGARPRPPAAPARVPRGETGVGRWTARTAGPGPARARAAFPGVGGVADRTPSRLPAELPGIGTPSGEAAAKPAGPAPSARDGDEASGRRACRSAPGPGRGGRSRPPQRPAPHRPPHQAGRAAGRGPRRTRPRAPGPPGAEAARHQAGDGPSRSTGRIRALPLPRPAPARRADALPRRPPGRRSRRGPRRHGAAPTNRRPAPDGPALGAEPARAGASLDYLARHGVPRSVAELGEHRGVVYTNRGAAD